MARRLGAAVVLLAWLARGAVASRDPLRRLSSALGLEVLELDEVAPQKQHGVDAAVPQHAQPTPETTLLLYDSDCMYCNTATLVSLTP